MEREYFKNTASSKSFWWPLHPWFWAWLLSGFMPPLHKSPLNSSRTVSSLAREREREVHASGYETRGARHHHHHLPPSASHNFSLSSLFFAPFFALLLSLSLFSPRYLRYLTYFCLDPVCLRRFFCWMHLRQRFFTHSYYRRYCWRSWWLNNGLTRRSPRSSIV